MIVGADIDGRRCGPLRDFDGIGILVIHVGEFRGNCAQNFHQDMAGIGLVGQTGNHIREVQQQLSAHRLEAGAGAGVMQMAGKHGDGLANLIATHFVTHVMNQVSQQTVRQRTQRLKCRQSIAQQRSFVQ